MLSKVPAKPAFRADQIGSFLRPPELLSKRAQFRLGAISITELRAFEDRAILDLLRMQKDIGLSVFSDGEVRREAWYSDFNEAIDGLGMVVGARTSAMVWRGVDGTEYKPEPGAAAQAAVEKINQKRRVTAHETGFMLRYAPGPFKITVPSPVVTASFIYRPDGAYQSREDLLADVTLIMRREMNALSDEGVAYIQMDEGFTKMVSENWAAQTRASGSDPDAEIAAAIAAENRCYSAVNRSRVTLGMHICRGNSRSRWVHQGGYDAVAERVFSELDVDRLLLEYDTERAGSFEPLRFVPKSKIVVLGLISTKIPQMESEDSVLRRIEEAAKYVPIEQLALSPQCGFASVKEGNLVTPDDQRRKLELVVRVAQKVWGEV